MLDFDCLFSLFFSMKWKLFCKIWQSSAPGQSRLAIFFAAPCQMWFARCWWVSGSGTMIHDSFALWIWLMKDSGCLLSRLSPVLSQFCDTCPASIMPTIKSDRWAFFFSHVFFFVLFFICVLLLARACCDCFFFCMRADFWFFEIESARDQQFLSGDRRLPQVDVRSE